MTKKYKIDYERLVEIIEEQPKLCWAPGEKPPPWKPPKASLKKYRQAMIDFVDWHLCDQLPEPDLTPNPPDVYKQHLDWLTELNKDRPEIEAAERGDIEPLRKKFPHLAKFLHLPPHPKHKRKTNYLPIERARRAVEDIPRVTALWEKFYKKKVRRFEPSTVEIVANLWGVEVKDVRQVLNQRKGKKHREKVS